MAKSKSQFLRRRQRVRTKLAKRRNDRPRLSIHRSNKHIYAQIIDDEKRVTLAAASTQDAALRENSGANIEGAAAVGKLIAERSKAAGVKEVVFDRGGYLYHGRVRALAEAAREGGLEF
ncbi:MAG: 50S ribosomal protein L18 [Alphaproteobacteria bacterium]|nr:MAG: 50S ribosomal protein L18 [Alphaproteobacteria bacterium]